MDIFCENSWELIVMELFFLMIELYFFLFKEKMEMLVIFVVLFNNIL